MLRILDTNLIIRYLFQDDIEVATQVEKIIETNRKKALQNKFRYKNREGFDKIRRLLCLEK